MKGWLRIGIVLSVMWCISFSVYALLRYRHFADECVVHMWETRNEGTWRVVGLEDHLFKCSLKDDLPEGGNYGTELIKSKTTCSVKMLPCLLWMSGPIIAAWLLIPVLVWSFLWVRKGFIGKNT